MLPIGPEKALNLAPYCPACLEEPHVDEQGQDLACPDVARGGGEGE